MLWLGLVWFGVCSLKPSPQSVSALAKLFAKTAKDFGRKIRQRKAVACFFSPPAYQFVQRQSLGSCRFSDLERHFLCGFFQFSDMSFGWECFCPLALFSLLLLPRQVVSSPRDQHFCCLCFWPYLRSPSCLLCPCLSCIREQLWPVVGLFHCIFTSGVSFHSFQSTTMDSEDLNDQCPVHNPSGSSHFVLPESIKILS